MKFILYSFVYMVMALNQNKPADHPYHSLIFPYIDTSHRRLQINDIFISNSVQYNTKTISEHMPYHKNCF